MSAYSSAGIKRHKAIRLGGGSVDNFTDIYLEGGAELGDFVDEGNIDQAEAIFKELGGFDDF